MQEQQAQEPQRLVSLLDAVRAGTELGDICAQRARLAELEPVPYTLTPLAETSLSPDRAWPFFTERTARS